MLLLFLPHSHFDTPCNSLQSIVTIYLPLVFICCMSGIDPVLLALLMNLQHVEFGIRLATCLGLDEAVSVLLSGEFACDAIITRAQQLARQEVGTGTCSVPECT